MAFRCRILYPISHYFTRNCRIYLQLQDLGQDKPISLLVKLVSVNKLQFPFEFSDCERLGKKICVFVTSKNNLNEIDISQGPVLIETTHSRHQSLGSAQGSGKLYVGEHAPQGSYSQKLAI